MFSLETLISEHIRYVLEPVCYKFRRYHNKKAPETWDHSFIHDIFFSFFLIEICGGQQLVSSLVASDIAGYGIWIAGSVQRRNNRSETESELSDVKVYTIDVIFC
jgi:hypothetical protein